MSALRFDPETCLACETVDCVMKCQYIDLDLPGPSGNMTGLPGVRCHPS
jgi:coenzyme F420-reducing hydrogenase gamma subunit